MIEVLLRLVGRTSDHPERSDLRQIFEPLKENPDLAALSEDALEWSS